MNSPTDESRKSEWRKDRRQVCAFIALMPELYNTSRRPVKSLNEKIFVQALDRPKNHRRFMKHTFVTLPLNGGAHVHSAGSRAS
jgi:hypothetical protein